MHGSAAKILNERFPYWRNLHQLAIPADHTLTMHVLDRRFCRAARNTRAHAAQEETQARCIRQSSFEMRGKTICGHNIESAGHEHNPGLFRVGVHRGERLETRNLPADIHIVTFCAQACICHLAKCMHERTRAMEHCVHLD